MLKHTFAMVLATATLPAMAHETKLPAPAISENLDIPRETAEVLNSTMAYLEDGSGPPVLFIHGNPTSSYLWRNIIPHVSDTHQAIAVDLIGMGASGKPDIGYSFDDHYRYLEAFIDALDLSDITFVVHDWGATLGWEYARQNPDRVARMAFMEGVLPPTFPVPDIAMMGEVGKVLAALRSDEGHEMVIEGNMFVEEMLPGFVNRELGEKAMTMYRAPYLEEASRLPTLKWPRELPIGGEPRPTTEIMEGIAAFMAETKMPVLALHASPGVVGTETAMDWYRDTIADVEIAFVGQGLHFIQEDQPEAIGRAIDDWLRRN